MDDEQAAQDAFGRGFLDLPSAEDMRAMPYMELCGMLAGETSGTTRHMIIEAEKRRRDAVALAEEVDKQVPKKPAPDHWYKKPIALIGFGVTIGLTVFLLGPTIKAHFGIP